MEREKLKDLYENFLEETLNKVNHLLEHHTNNRPLKAFKSSYKKETDDIDIFCLVNTEDSSFPIIKEEIPAHFATYAKGEQTMRASGIILFETLINEYYKIEDDIFTKNKLLHLEDLCCEVVDKEKNAEILETLPHVDFLNASIIFRHEISKTGLTNKLITKDYLEEIGCSADDLLEMFLSKNSKFSTTLCKTLKIDNETCHGVKILQKNETSLHTGCILDTETLSKISEEYLSDLYVSAASPFAVVVASASLFSEERFHNLVCTVKNQFSEMNCYEKALAAGYVLEEDCTKYVFDYEEKNLTAKRPAKEKDGNVCYVDFSKKKVL